MYLTNTSKYTAHLDEYLPRHGFFWWVQDRPRPTSELGNNLPRDTYQSLGFYGNACIVIPETLLTDAYETLNANCAGSATYYRYPLSTVGLAGFNQRDMRTHVKLCFLEREAAPKAVLPTFGTASYPF